MLLVHVSACEVSLCTSLIWRLQLITQLSSTSLALLALLALSALLALFALLVISPLSNLSTVSTASPISTFSTVKILSCRLGGHLNVHVFLTELHEQ